VRIGGAPVPWLVGVCLVLIVGEETSDPPWYESALAGSPSLDPDGELLETGPAIAAMLAWIGVTFAAAGALLKHRDPR
jgi:hypothetical protein